MTRFLRAVAFVFVLLPSCVPAGPDVPDVPFSGEVIEFSPVDEANLTVLFEVINEGSEAAKGGCTIQAKDASGRIVGFDIFSSRKKIQPGETIRSRGVIRIEDEGAFRVRRVQAKDCESE